MASRTTNNNIIGDFQILAHLGDGSYSSVYKVKRISDGLEYALKKVKMVALSAKEKENALNEVRILASLSDPYVIGYKEAFFEDSTGALCLIMTYAGGGDLYQKIVEHQRSRTFFPEKDIWRYLYYMIRGLRSLHKLNILHRDLKSANVFLTSDGYSALLGDLNVSKVAKTNLVYTQTGTPYYASPEVWKDQPYDKKSDIWSLGCVIYELAGLKPPFRSQDMQGLYRKVQKGQYDKLPARYSAELARVIAACLNVLPSQRPSCDELLEMVEIRKNCHEYMYEDDEDTETKPKRNLAQPTLLNTIKIPKNWKAANLPKPNYGAVPKKKPEGFLPPIAATAPEFKEKSHLAERNSTRQPAALEHQQSQGNAAPVQSRRYILPANVQQQIGARNIVATPKAPERRDSSRRYVVVHRQDSKLNNISMENEQQREGRSKVTSRQLEEQTKPLQPQNQPNREANVNIVVATKNGRPIVNSPAQLYMAAAAVQSPPSSIGNNHLAEREKIRQNELISRAHNIINQQQQQQQQPQPLAHRPNNQLPSIGIYNNKNMNYHENLYDYDAMINKRSVVPALMQQHQVNVGGSRKSAYPDWWG